ncbi:MAG: aquaporin [Acidimicrobiia bacterium]
MIIHKTLAELLGTFILVGLGSLGILTVAGAGSAAQIIAIAFAFGFALLAAIWALGHVSGAHFNPAVTLGFLLNKEMSFSDAIAYWIGQFAGASLASAVIWVATDRAAVASTATTYTDFKLALIVEIVLTTVFVWMILVAVKRGGTAAPGAIALTLVGVHLAGITSSGASVNPARSFGPAVVGGADISQLGLYIYAPLIGAVIAWALYRIFPVEESS